MPAAPIARRLALLLVATAVALLGAELFARWWTPGEYALPWLMTSDGRRAPLFEGWHFLYHGLEAERESPEPVRGRMPASMRLRQGYDRPAWDYFDTDGAIPVTSNRLGFHDREFAVAKPGGELRVLALGDSFTYGLGVRLEDSWPQVLEAALAQDVARAEVVNAGWPNTSPADTLGWFRAHGAKLGADVILVGLCLNDMAPVQMLAYPQAEIDAPWLGGVSVLLDHVQRELEQRRLIAVPRDHAETIDADPSQWLATQQALLAIRDHARAEDLGFGLVVIPMMSGLGDDCPYARMHEIARAFCEENDIPCLDLLPVFRGRDERDLWVHPIDQHPNHVAHRLIAERVHAFLHEHELVAADEDPARDPRTGITFVEIAPATFDMGGTAAVNAPVHRVRVSRPFWIAQTEVTVGQWRRFVERDGGEGPAPPDGDPRRPMTGLTWREVDAFCKTYGYAIPTEAQWELACRCGPGVGWWRDRAELERRAWIYANAGERAHATATREPCPRGLYDMLGNVWEICADGWASGYAVADPTRVVTDPQRPADGAMRTIRGGSWFSAPVPWPGDRQYWSEDYRSELVGFRPVRVAE